MSRRPRARRAMSAAALAMALAAACHTGRTSPASGSVMADTALIRRDIAYLASPALEGRATGTPGNDSAAAYLVREYRRLGLDSIVVGGSCPMTRPGVMECKLTGTTYEQRFTARSVAAAHAGLPGELPTQNVVAMQLGTDSALRREYVILGAHYDHLGRTTFSALDPEAKNAIRPGADDNASGTAAVLELARRFAAHPARRSIIFANFSAEELGDIGSEYFVQHSPVPLDRTQIMLNFDMVGRLRNDRLIVYGVSTATELRSILDSANASLDSAFALNAVGDGFGPSDHASFYGADVPVLYFFTDLHEDYHRATDVASKINVPGEARVIALAERVARSIADRPSRLTFVRAKAPPPSTSMPGPGGTYFGSVPDMGATDVVGVRLAGVTPGSPADEAGVKKGDVVVEFGGVPVKDLYGYTDALRAHKPGDTVQVVVERDGQRVTLTATLGRRAQ